MKVLLVDDDVELLDLLAYALGRDGHAVSMATSGERGLQRWEAERPDVVLLDVGLPKLDGFEVCRRIRERARTPIVMLTARDDEADILRGLQLGADDYLIKPFSVRHLRARLQAVVWRSQRAAHRQATGDLRVGDLALDLRSHEVTQAGQPVHLTRTEFRLLHLLALHAGQLLPYAILVAHIWPGSAEADSRRLKAHVTRLRRQLRLPRDALVAVPGVGYRLTRPR